MAAKKKPKLTRAQERKLVQLEREDGRATTMCGFEDDGKTALVFSPDHVYRLLTSKGELEER